MPTRKGRKIGHEEEIVKELDNAGFMSSHEAGLAFCEPLNLRFILSHVHVLLGRIYPIVVCQGLSVPRTGSVLMVMMVGDIMFMVRQRTSEEWSVFWSSVGKACLVLLHDKHLLHRSRGPDFVEDAHVVGQEMSTDLEKVQGSDALIHIHEV